MLTVAYHWAGGMSFAALCATTPLLEGDIVRHVSRLDEVCKEDRASTSYARRCAKIPPHPRLDSTV
eukprot:1604486-Prymnesium_polylepis.1